MSDEQELEGYRASAAEHDRLVTACARYIKAFDPGFEGDTVEWLNGAADEELRELAKDRDHWWY